jgi:heme/copper-type cytochrome/quinol oxidase subunit 1
MFNSNLAMGVASYLFINSRTMAAAANLAALKAFLFNRNSWSHHMYSVGPGASTRTCLLKLTMIIALLVGIKVLSSLAVYILILPAFGIVSSSKSESGRRRSSTT